MPPHLAHLNLLYCRLRATVNPPPTVAWGKVAVPLFSYDGHPSQPQFMPFAKARDGGGQTAETMAERGGKTEVIEAPTYACKGNQHMFPPNCEDNVMYVLECARCGSMRLHTGGCLYLCS